MKKIIYLTFLLIGPLCLQAQITPVISEPLSVSNYSPEYGKHLPRVLSFEDGTIVVFWSKAGSNPAIYFSRLEGDEFGPVIEIPTGLLEPDIWSGGLGPAYAVRGNSIFVTFEVWGDAIYLVRSNDGGLIFEDPVTALVPIPGRAATLPAIALDGDGNPVIGCITTDFSEQDARYEVVRSSDGGATFQPPVTASTAADGEEVCECCPSNLIVSEEGHIFASFRNNNSNTRDIWVSRSTDEGMNFSDAADVDATNWYISGCPSTGPQSIISGGKLLNVFFSAGAGWEQGVYISSLDMAGFVAGPTIKLPHIDGNEGIQNFPRIAAGDDTLGIVWHEHTGSFYNVAFTWSVAGPGGIEEQAIELNNGGTPHVYPDIHYSQGRFHLVYEDQASGTPLYQTVELSTATGREEPFETSGIIRLYPNPAKQSFKILKPESDIPGFRIEIMDITGNLVLEKKLGPDENSVTIDHLQTGSYTVRLFSGKTTLSTKLMVE